MRNHGLGSSNRILTTLLAADVLAVIAAYYSAILFRFYSRLGDSLVVGVNRALRIHEFVSTDEGISFATFYLVSAPRIITLLALTFIVFYVGMDLYAGRRLLRPRSEAGDIVRANFFALLFFFAYLYLSRNQLHPRSMFAVIAVFNTACTLLFRTLAHRWLRSLRDREGVDKCPVLIVGDGTAMQFLADWIEAVNPHGLYVVERVLIERSKFSAEDLDMMRGKIEACGAEMLILAAPGLGMESIMLVLEMTAGIRIPTKILSAEFEIIGTRTALRTDRIMGLPLVHFAPPPLSCWYYAIKRVYSVVLASLALLALAPVMLVIGLAIRCGSRGPALFVQDRIGINRIPFRMYKFRTMYEQAEEMQSQVEDFNESERGLFKIRRDPRVTPFGRFLRRFSLDELPQLFNVLRGDMTLVGPRPLPRRDLANYYQEWHYIRHGGLPGLTCLWQVAGRSELDFHSMCLLDNYYLRNQTLALDVRILVRTAWAVLFARGAY